MKMAPFPPSALTVDGALMVSCVLAALNAHFQALQNDVTCWEKTEGCTMVPACKPWRCGCMCFSGYAEGAGAQGPKPSVMLSS